MPYDIGIVLVINFNVGCQLSPTLYFRRRHEVRFILHTATLGKFPNIANKVSVHTASRVSRVASFVGLGLVGLGLASQASRVYLRGVPIHTATGVASRVYSISLFQITGHHWPLNHGHSKSNLLSEAQEAVGQQVHVPPQL